MLTSVSVTMEMVVLIHLSFGLHPVVLPAETAICQQRLDSVLAGRQSDQFYYTAEQMSTKLKHEFKMTPAQFISCVSIFLVHYISHRC